LSQDSVAILGAGSWGTALCGVLREGGPVSLWSRDREQASAMNALKRNPRYLTEAQLPSDALISNDLAQVLRGADLVVVAAPAKAMVGTARALSAVLRSREYRREEPPLVLSGAKGLDPETGRRMTEVLGEALQDRAVVGALSGPNIAYEVALGLPTATVIACHNTRRAERAQKRISGRRLRAYTNDDVVGVEMGGALKNVIAIAAGISDGMQVGDNAKAAIMTRGLVEMTRLGVALGARQPTFSGLTGLGDLIVTCSSPHSRNRQLGVGIGQGRTLEDIEASMRMVAEGVNTTREAIRLGTRLGVDLPITAALSAILFQGATLMEVVSRLMARSGKSEREGLGITG
jgi:glycerol-3-phosphate dehydrogenase (NAD(P)+)